MFYHITCPGWVCGPASSSRCRGSEGRLDSRTASDGWTEGSGKRSDPPAWWCYWPGPEETCQCTEIPARDTNPDALTSQSCDLWLHQTACVTDLRQGGVELEYLAFTFHLPHAQFTGELQRTRAESLQSESAVEVTLRSAPHLLEWQLLQHRERDGQTFNTPI